ncbi:MAG: TraB/GumN family protein, partial [Gammaproteobacteria bacterium]|nr:TraB/GumN family protein [Gammaproteobacteria bacterium]
MPFLLLGLNLAWTQVFAASPVWRVETGDGHLYIGGTVHLLRAADYPLPAAFDRAYADAQIVVFETSVSDNLTPDQQQAMLQATRLPGDQTIDEVLAAGTLKELDNHIEQNGLTPEAFNRLRPGMIALTLTLIELRHLGVTQIGVDQHYIQRSS